MPTYCYSRNGEVIEQYYPMGEAPQRVRLGRRVYERDYTAERALTRPPANWPMESDALGVHESQIEQARAESVRVGVPTDFTRDGRAILTSPGHRKRYAEAIGFFDRNAGYSDPLPKRIG
jgi:hypothetical protein